MRLMILSTFLILAGCAQPATVNQDDIVMTENTVDLGEPEPAPTIAPDGNAVEVADDDPGQTKGTLHICDFGGWSADRDPKGLNVRAGPSASARIVRTLPAPAYDPDYEREMAPGFDVFESRDGWFLIGVLDTNDVHHYKAIPWGWVHGSKIDFAVQSDVAFTAPDPASPVAVTSWEDKDGGHPFTYRHPVDCKGHWVQLTVAGQDGRERIAWTRGICEGQETTCDGGIHRVHGDLSPPTPAR
jgi:hypothetical protein